MPLSKRNSSYKGILKSTSLMGGSAFVEMLIGMVRIKFVAVLLGPSGVGILGVYTNIVNVFTTVFGIGVPTSGVQRISKACATKDQDQLAMSVVAIRRICLIGGTMGMLATFVGCKFISGLSFRNTDYSFGVFLLGIVVFLGLIRTGQSCIIRGNRRITDMAQVNILSALCGTIICIPCYYLWGIQGIAPSMLLVATVSLMISTRFVSHIQIKSIQLSWKENHSEIQRILFFGLPLMLSALMGVLVPYLARLFLVRQVGLDGVGLFQAAFNLSGILVSFVLAAMAADYYPRLTLVANDHSKVREEVNIQTEIALLLGVPGLAATIIFAPFVITIFYSIEFIGAIDIIRWSIYGIFGQLASWPLGFVILAKGEGKIFFFMELFSNSFYLLMLWVCTNYWGLPGIGIAFSLLYGFNIILRLILFYILADGYWTLSNLLHIFIFLVILVGLSLNCAITQNLLFQWILNLVLLSGVTTYCLWRLQNSSGLSIQMLKHKLRKCLK